MTGFFDGREQTMMVITSAAAPDCGTFDEPFGTSFFSSPEKRARHMRRSRRALRKHDGYQGLFWTHSFVRSQCR
jgi:hypothetical protein